MSAVCSPVLLVGRPIASLATQRTILEKAGYTVTVITGEQEASYMLTKHKMATSVLSLPNQVLQQHIFAAVILCHTVPMEERHRIGSMVRGISETRPKLLVLHRSGNGPESQADAAIDSLEGQGKILALLSELIVGKQARAAAAASNLENIEIEYVGQQVSASGKTTSTALEPKSGPLLKDGRFAT